MHDQTRDDIDEALANAFSDVRVSDELKAATMAHIAQARAEEQEKGQVDEPEKQPERHGNVVDMGPRKGVRKRILAIAASIALCLVIAGGGFGALTQTETAYAEVATSSNQSSVTLGVNRFDSVVNARAANPEMQKRIDAIGLRGKSYDEAMEALVQSGYLDEQDVDVHIGGSDAKQQQKMVESTTTCLEQSGHRGECNGHGFGKRDGSGYPDAPHDGSGNGPGSGNGQHQGDGGHHGSGHE